VKRLLQIAFILLVINSAYCQKHYFGIKSGINISNINSHQYILLHEVNRKGFNGGLTYNYRLKSRFDFGVDLLFIQKGFATNLIYTNYFGEPTGEKHKIKYNYDYISLPIKSGFLI